MQYNVPPLMTFMAAGERVASKLDPDWTTWSMIWTVLLSKVPVFDAIQSMIVVVVIKSGVCVYIQRVKRGNG